MFAPRFLNFYRSSHMRISASVSSLHLRDLKSTVIQLDAHGIDCYHLDSVENREIFSFARLLRPMTDKPMDLHIITSDPVKYWGEIRATQIEATSVQLESLRTPLHIPDDLLGKVGIAVLANSPMELFAPYRKQAAWLLLMTTTPGYSGGTFQMEQFANIIRYRQMYPELPVIVDGGVTHEIAAVLRMLGVHQIVSGSYLFSSNSPADAIRRLRNAVPGWKVRDIMAYGFDAIELDDTSRKWDTSKPLEYITSQGERLNVLNKTYWKETKEFVSKFIQGTGNPILVSEDLPLNLLEKALRKQPATSTVFIAVNGNSSPTGSLFIDLS
jgi:ribulose-phosphate 3-epimerase